MNFFTNKNNKDKGQETMNAKNINETSMTEILKSLVEQEVAKQSEDKVAAKPLKPSAKEGYTQERIDDSITSNKWIDAYGIAKIFNISDVTARRWMREGYFGSMKGRGTNKKPRKVLTEKVMAVDIKDFFYKQSKDRVTKQKESLRNYKEKDVSFTADPSTPNNAGVIHLTGDQVVQADKINYEEYRKKLMNDKQFLKIVSINVMSNLKFVTRLEEGNNG